MSGDPLDRASELFRAADDPIVAGRTVKWPEDSQRLTTLLEVQQAMAGLEDPHELLSRTLDRILETTGADRGTVFVVESTTGDLIPKVSRGLDPATLDDAASYSRNILETTRDKPTVVHSYDTRGDKRFNRFESVADLEICSFICVPILHEENVLGTVYVDCRHADAHLTEEDVDFLLAFTAITGAALSSLARHADVVEENEALRAGFSDRLEFGNVVASSPVMRPVMDLVRRLTETDVTVLIQGETGTGKEVIARAIHYHGGRKRDRFVAVNCAAMPEALVESELFGHRRGAFTDAREDKKGLFESADGGTIFLDEVGELPPSAQAKLLRVLQESEVTRVGETEVRTIDVRVISATNRDLAKEVEKGMFREDLFYRLNVVAVDLPPLRERPEDIPLLAAHFLDKYRARYRKELEGLAPDAVKAMSRRAWPGNVRQLENEIERAVALARPGEEITVELLTSDSEGGGAAFGGVPGSARLVISDADRPLVLEGFSSSRDLKARVEAFERALLAWEIELHEGNKTQAAKTLGLSRAGLNKKLAKLEARGEQ